MNEDNDITHRSARQDAPRARGLDTRAGVPPLFANRGQDHGAPEDPEAMRRRQAPAQIAGGNPQEAPMFRQPVRNEQPQQAAVGLEDRSREGRPQLDERQRGQGRGR